MKTRVLIVILVNLLSLTALLATEISPSTATTVAKNFFSAQIQEEVEEIEVKQTFTYTNSKGIAIYIVTFKEGGFVMVSGDDSMQPVIGYGLENEVPTLSQKNDLHPMLQTKLDKTQSQQQLRLANVNTERQELWNEL